MPWYFTRGSHSLNLPRPAQPATSATSATSANKCKFNCSRSGIHTATQSTQSASSSAQFQNECFQHVARNLSGRARGHWGSSSSNNKQAKQKQNVPIRLNFSKCFLRCALLFYSACFAAEMIKVFLVSSGKTNGSCRPAQLTVLIASCRFDCGFFSVWTCSTQCVASARWRRPYVIAGQAGDADDAGDLWVRRHLFRQSVQLRNSSPSPT